MVTSLLSNNVIIVLFTTITFLVLQVNITTVEIKYEIRVGLDFVIFLNRIYIYDFLDLWWRMKFLFLTGKILSLHTIIE